jgi:glutamate-ammonia-ligase adenylyltransferase
MIDTMKQNMQAEIDALPDLLRAPVRLWLESLEESGAVASGWTDASPPARENLVRLVASSEFAARALVREWDWFVTPETTHAFDRPLDTPGLKKLARDMADSETDAAALKSRLRRLRNRCLLHILWRVTSGQDDVWATLRSLSDLADSLIEASMRHADRHLSGRFGQPLNPNGESVAGIVLAMGKLGGRELNFSSDIDLIFLYSGEGETDGPRSLSAREYFTRYSQLVVALLDEVTQDGFVYRVDTRLRPFGDSGPPVVSFAALENYLLQHGRGWERYAYIKARVISPSATEENIRDLHSHVIDPFVYRRYLDYGVFESLREMKALIEVEVKKRELANNIKLGPGGIREIEFIAQSLQLVRGGADRALRCRELRRAMTHLTHARCLGEESVAVLMPAYEFLRRVENAIQAIRDQQTHDLPADSIDQARIALVVGARDWNAVLSEIEQHRAAVSKQFAAVAFRGDDQKGGNDTLRMFAGLWANMSSCEEWEAALQSAGYEDATQLGAAIGAFANSPAQRQTDVAAQKRLARFIPSLLVALRNYDRPGVICERVLSVISQILRRSAYVAMLNENPPVLERLMDLCGQSAYLAGEIARYPILLDELLDPRLYAAQISAAQMQADVEGRLEQVNDADSEARIEVLAQFQRTTLFRIAVADVVGKLPIMKVSDALTGLAEIVLEVALETAWSDLVAKHGEPVFAAEQGVRKAGLGVIAYGKLGGIELSYGSDLDLVFLHNSRGSGQMTDGASPLENSMFFSRLVRRLVHCLTIQTGSGALYEIDTRLRPSGHSGLLVVSTESFAKYQEENAWTWEHQALLRGRAVAGSTEVAREFERIRKDTLTNRVRRDDLLSEVIAMRGKMRDRLDKSTTEQFDLKQGEGGIGDIEFLVQYLVLKYADREPALLVYSDNIRQLDALAVAGLLDADAVAQLQDAYKTYRHCAHRLTLDDEPPLVAATEFGAERAFVRSVWQREMK